MLHREHEKQQARATHTVLVIYTLPQSRDDGAPSDGDPPVVLSVVEDGDEEEACWLKTTISLCSEATRK